MRTCSGNTISRCTSTARARAPAMRMTYWAAGPAGHIEALEAFADFFIERLPECRAFCRKIFKGGDGAVIPPTMGYAAQPILGWTAYTLHPSHGIWAFNTFCDAWDYDPTPEKAAKYLAFGRELAAGLEHAWKIDEKGVRRLDLSCSPEVGDNRNECFLTPNSTYDRVIFDGGRPDLPVGAPKSDSAVRGAPFGHDKYVRLRGKYARWVRHESPQ